jgi:hypothetical protein
MATQETVDKITSIIYYLYHESKMNPNSMVGGHLIKDVFENACNVLLGMTADEFAEREKELSK